MKRILVCLSTKSAITRATPSAAVPSNADVRRAVFYVFRSPPLASAFV
jgi:hypothetical protein